MCMFFKKTSEPVKQIGVWLGIVVLLPLSTWYGTSTFSPPTNLEEARKKAAQLDKKTWTATDEGEKEKLNQEKDAVDKEVEEAARVFYGNMFWVAYPVGLVAVIGGILFRVQPVGGGLVFGGLASLSAGCYSFWDSMEGWHRFASVVLVLVALIVLGSWRYWRPVLEQPSMSFGKSESLT